MNVSVVAVGRLKERFWRDACDEYLKRVKPYFKVEVHELQDFDPAKCGGEAAAREKEAQGILAALKSDAFVILLDIQGELVSSEELSAQLDDCALKGKSNVAFVIGGSTGVAQSVMARADMRVSFGRITLPHNLARVVLLEQLYRAAKISKGEPYHK